MKKESIKDRRTRFTRNEIKSTYIALLDQMPKNKITVTMLCEETGINRGTFYLHYETLDDVWKDIENDLIQESEDIMNLAQANGKKIDPISHVQHQKNSELWSKIYFGPHASQDLHERIMQQSIKDMAKFIPEGIMTEEEKRVYLNFVIGGCMAVEKDRFHHPWKDFDATNDFYNRITTLISDKFAGGYKKK